MSADTVFPNLDQVREMDYESFLDENDVTAEPIAIPESEWKKIVSIGKRSKKIELDAALSLSAKLRVVLSNDQNLVVWIYEDNNRQVWRPAWLSSPKYYSTDPGQYLVDLDN